MVTPARTGAIRDGLLVSGADVLWVRDALRELERRARLNGGSAPARLRALVDLADDVAGSTVVGLTLSPAAETGSRHMPVESSIGTERAAELLGCSSRYVRDQCDAGAFLSARKRGGRWTVDEAEVLTLVEARQAATRSAGFR